jgi:hypothetical protein
MRRRPIYAAAVGTAAVAGLLAIANPVTADAATPPSTAGLPAGITFVTPSVGAISVDLGATIINGKVIAPAVHVLAPGASLPAFSWTPSTSRPSD